MGHDIYGYKPSDAERKNKVAHLRRTETDARNLALYLALSAENFYAGVSGTGDEQTFSRAEINAALEHLYTAAGVLADEIRFLKICLKEMENDQITIFFN